MRVSEGGRKYRNESLLRFVTSIHECLEVEELGASYIAGISEFLPANAYGFYLLDQADGRPSRVAVRGGVDRYIDRYEEVGYECDPLMKHMFRTREPVHEGMLFSDKEWQRQPLRQALKVQKMVRVLEAPLVLGGRVFGTLFFSRSPQEPAFADSELGVLALITRHAGAAMDRALRHLEAKERYLLAEGALKLIDRPLILSDEQGNVKFVNRPAQLLILKADSASSGAGFVDHLKENLLRLAAGSGEVAVSSFGLGNRSTASKEIIKLRSMSIPGVKHSIATFVCVHDEVCVPDFQGFGTLLPKREIEVLRLLAQGLQNKEIARRLSVSTNTIKYHLKQMYLTMNVSSRSELLSKAYAGQYGDSNILPN